MATPVDEPGNADRRDAWIEEYFAEIGKVLGPSAWKGASRTFDGKQFGYEPSGLERLFLWINKNANPPMMNAAAILELGEWR